MGHDKALLEIDGRPLWRRQRDLLSSAGATEIFLSARPDQLWVSQTRTCFDSVLHDAMPDCGPLAGVAAGLERASQPLLAVLAVDLPAMSADWFRILLAR